MVHRLDKDTSGLLLLAFDKPALGALGSQFEHRRVEKYYVARVWGEVAGDSGLIDLPLATDWENKPRQRVDLEHGRAAQTRWEVLAREPGATRLKLTPLTGRTHQLRVHMLALGHPILGDSFYGEGEALRAADRLQLHAEKLSFTHPEDHRLMRFIAPRAVLNACRRPRHNLSPKSPLDCQISRLACPRGTAGVMRDETENQANRGA